MPTNSPRAWQGHDRRRCVARRSPWLAGITTGMNVGDQVVYFDDEPELDLPEGIPATVTAFYEPRLRRIPARRLSRLHHARVLALPRTDPDLTAPPAPGQLNALVRTAHPTSPPPPARLAGRRPFPRRSRPAQLQRSPPRTHPRCSASSRQSHTSQASSSSRRTTATDRPGLSQDRCFRPDTPG